MIDMKLTVNNNFNLPVNNYFNDLAIENGDIALISDGAEVAQAVSIFTKTIQGEFKLNLMAGLNIDDFYSASTSMALKQSILMDIIYDTPGVKKINSFEVKMHKPSMVLFVEANVDTYFADDQTITLTV